MSRNFLSQDFGSDEEDDDFNPAPGDVSDNEVKVGSDDRVIMLEDGDAEYRGIQSERGAVEDNEGDNEDETNPDGVPSSQPARPEIEEVDEDENVNGDADEDEQGNEEDEDEEEEDEDEDDEEAVSVGALFFFYQEYGLRKGSN